MKMVSAAPASRSEEEDRELVPRRRGPAALDLRLLRRRHVALVDASFEVEALDAVGRGPDRLAVFDLRDSVGAIDFLLRRADGRFDRARRRVTALGDLALRELGGLVDDLHRHGRRVDA